MGYDTLREGFVDVIRVGIVDLLRVVETVDVEVIFEGRISLQSPICSRLLVT